MKTVEGLPAGSPRSAVMTLSCADVRLWKIRRAGIKCQEMIRDALTDAA
jgi:hypothetical protein